MAFSATNRAADRANRPHPNGMISPAQPTAAVAQVTGRQDLCPRPHPAADLPGVNGAAPAEAAAWATHDCGRIRRWSARCGQPGSTLPRAWTARAYRPRSRRPGRPRAAPHRSPILGIVDWRQAASVPWASRRWHSASGRVLPQPGQIAPGGRPGPCEASAVTASAVNRPHWMGNVGTRPAGGRSGGTMCMRLTPPFQAFSHGSINYRAPSCPRSTSQLASTSPISSHSHSDRRPADLMEGLPIQRGWR